MISQPQSLDDGSGKLSAINIRIQRGSRFDGLETYVEY